MEELEVRQPDSGYPTPRDDVPSSSRSISPHSPLTSTPARPNTEPKRSLKKHFSTFHDESMHSDSSITVRNDKSPLLNTVKYLVKISREIKSLKRENDSLREESRRTNDENESFRQMDVPEQVIPKLNLDFVNLKLKEEIKKELITSSYIKIDGGDQSVLQQKLKNMLDNEEKKRKVITATATIQVDTDKTDADVQTDTVDSEVDPAIINTTLQIEVDQLTSKLEDVEMEKIDLNNRLFDYEKLKETFEKNEEKLRADLERMNSKRDRTQRRIEDLELRLTNIRKENEEVREENQRLCEDVKVHDFEMEEIRIQLEDVQKCNEDKIELISKLENKLEKQSCEIKDLEENEERKEEEHRKELKRFQEQIDSIMSDGSSANEKLKETMEENRKIEEMVDKLKKENAYLTEAEKTLIESEMDWKNKFTDVSATLRSVEEQLSKSQQVIQQESERRIHVERDNEKMKTKISELEEKQFDADVLLAELKKGKEEIDFLRKEVSRSSEGSEELKALKLELVEKQKEISSLEEKIEQTNRNELESRNRVENLIREAASSEKEVETLRKELELKNNVNAQLVKEKQVYRETCEVLKHEKDHLEHEYADFKENAFLQHTTEVNDLQNLLINAQTRLVELETYPGQHLSTEKANQLTQTDTPTSHSAEDNDVISTASEHIPIGSPDVSIVGSLHSASSSHSNAIEMKIDRLTSKLRENLEDESPLSTEICQQVIDLIDHLRIDSTAPVAGASRFWSYLSKKITLVEKELKTLRKDAEEKGKVLEKLEVLENELSSANNQLRATEEQLDTEIQMHQELQRSNNKYEQEVQIMIEERARRDNLIEEYKSGVLEEIKVHVTEYNEAVNELKEAEKIKAITESENRSLRSRLEEAQHQIEKLKRELLNREDANDEDSVALTSRLDRNTDILNDMSKKLAEVEKERDTLLTKRKFDKKTMEQMKTSFEMNDQMLKQSRKSNTDRHDLLLHVLESMKELELMPLDDRRIAASQIRSDVLQMSRRIEQDNQHEVSIQINRDNFEISSQSNSRNQNPRRAFGKVNNK